MEAHSRAMVLGVWEGILLAFLVDSSRTSTPADSDTKYYTHVLGTGLAFGVGGRLFLDYTTSGDVEVLARGVVGMTVGVLVGEFARNALLTYTDPVVPVVVASSDVVKRKHTRRRVQTDEEVLEGNVPGMSAAAAQALIPAITGVPVSHTTTTRIAPVASSSSRARPRVTTTTTTSATEPLAVPIGDGTTVLSPVRVPVLSAGVTRDMLRTGRRTLGRTNPSSSAQPLGQVLEEDPDSEQALERDVQAADSQRRVLSEEREWARAKGDADRSAELDAEIKRYKALSAELEARLKRRRSSAYSDPKTPGHQHWQTLFPKQNTLILVDERSPTRLHVIPDPLFESRSSSRPTSTHDKTGRQSVPTVPPSSSSSRPNDRHIPEIRVTPSRSSLRTDDNLHNRNDQYTPENIIPHTTSQPSVPATADDRSRSRSKDIHDQSRNSNKSRSRSRSLGRQISDRSLRSRRSRLGQDPIPSDSAGPARPGTPHSQAPSYTRRVSDPSLAASARDAEQYAYEPAPHFHRSSSAPATPRGQEGEQQQRLKTASAARAKRRTSPTFLSRYGDVNLEPPAEREQIRVQGDLPPAAPSQPPSEQQQEPRRRVHTSSQRHKRTPSWTEKAVGLVSGRGGRGGADEAEARTPVQISFGRGEPTGGGETAAAATPHFESRHRADVGASPSAAPQSTQHHRARESSRPGARAPSPSATSRPLKSAMSHNLPPNLGPAVPIPSSEYPDPNVPPFTPNPLASPYIQRVLSVTPAKDKKGVRISFESPPASAVPQDGKGKGKEVTILAGRPPTFSTDETPPDSSDEWSRALD